MMLLIEPTGTFVRLDGRACRVWTGVTARGTPVQAFIAALRCPVEADQPDLAAELLEIGSPEFGAL